MKKWIVLILLLFSVSVYAGNLIVGTGGMGTSGGGAAYCSGGELFCEDFEGEDVAWDADPDTEDCDGYDTDGDFCDDDTTNYKNGSEGCGLRGTTTYYFQEALSSASDEFYIEFWVKFSDVTTVNSVNIRSADYATKVVKLYLDSESNLVVYVNNDAVTYDGSYTFIADTWTHVGVYYKEEPGINDGIVRAWIDTDGVFVAGDLDINETAVDTGSTDGAGLRIYGSSIAGIAVYDDLKVVDGEPSWPTS